MFCLDLFFQFLNPDVTILISNLIGNNVFPQVLDDDFLSAGGILSRAQFHGLATYTRVQVIACQNQNGDDPNPKQENDKRADGAIKHIIAREVGDIGIESHGAQNK